MEIPQSCTKPTIYIDGLVQDSSVSAANALETAQFCAKPEA